MKRTGLWPSIDDWLFDVSPTLNVVESDADSLSTTNIFDVAPKKTNEGRRNTNSRLILNQSFHNISSTFATRQFRPNGQAKLKHPNKFETLFTLTGRREEGIPYNQSPTSLSLARRRWWTRARKYRTGARARQRKRAEFLGFPCFFFRENLLKGKAQYSWPPCI